ncbi:MAG: polysaccharide deacetylase family protein [Afipia sp.]|nr:polysaccharide deacetylase family protein [Afipia sp.]
MRLIFVSAVMLLSLASGVASASTDCPGNPGALGTSRTIAVDPVEHTRLGTMQYPETLPLRDHEVVLTFDDGPLPAHTNAILDILAAQCVKATFFMVGRMAKESPEAVRRVFSEGHSIGTHSENHPFHFGEMPPERIRSEIDDGIAHVTEALGDPAHLAPFFRIPGLRRSDEVESYLAGRGIMVWSADFLADDWRHISSTQVVRLALSRLEAKGKGIFLLHDIQERTVVALPVILRELKARGYRIVHVVPATATEPKTATDPQQWFFNTPPEQTPMAKLSVQSIWLARAAPITPSSEIVLRNQTQESFSIDAPDEGQQGPLSKSATNHTRLPGSWPIAAEGFNSVSPLEAKLIAEPDLRSFR